MGVIVDPTAPASTIQRQVLRKDEKKGGENNGDDAQLYKVQEALSSVTTRRGDRRYYDGPRKTRTAVKTAQEGYGIEAPSGIAGPVTKTICRTGTRHTGAVKPTKSCNCPVDGLQDPANRCGHQDTAGRLRTHRGSIVV